MRLRLLFLLLLGAYAPPCLAPDDTPPYLPPQLTGRVTHPVSGRRITFGIESEFQPIGAAVGLVDERTMLVDQARVPFAYPRATRENRMLVGPSTNNLEINTLPVGSIDEATEQMNVLGRNQGLEKDGAGPKPKGSGARGFHMHIFVPKEFFDSLPEAEREPALRAFVARLSDSMTARRLIRSHAYYALGTKTVGWQAPQDAYEKGAMKLAYKSELGVWDIEIRGGMNDIPYLRQVASQIVEASKNPELIRHPPTKGQEALHLQVQDLSEFLRSYGIAGDPKLHYQLERLNDAAHRAHLPLHRFDEHPFFAAKKDVIDAANRRFAIAIADLGKRMAAVARTDKYDFDAFQKEYREAIKTWGKEIKIDELLGRDYVFTKGFDEKEQDAILAQRAVRAHALSTSEPLWKAVRVPFALRGTRHPDGIALLLSIATKHPEPAMRNQAAGGLSAVPIDQLEATLKQLKGEALQYALGSLRGRKDPGLVGILKRVALVDGDGFVPGIYVLGGIDDPEALRLLKEYAQLPGRDAFEKDARREAILGLSQRSDADSRDFLVKLLSSKDQLVRQAAAEAMAGRNDSESLQAVIDFAKANPNSDVLPNLIEGLSFHPDKEKLGELLALTAKHSKEAVRASTAIAAGHSRNEAILTRMAKDARPAVRIAAMRAFENFPTHPEAAALLESALKDGSEGVRAAAFTTLLTRGDRESLDAVQKVAMSQADRKWLSRLLFRPSLGPDLTDAEIESAVLAVRSGRSILGDCLGVWEILSGR